MGQYFRTPAIYANTANTCDKILAGRGTEIGPAIESFIRWAEVIPTHTVVDGQVLGGSPVIREVDAGFVQAYSRELIVVVVSVESREAEKEARRGISTFAGRIARIGKRGRKVKAAVAQVGLIDGQLAAAEVCAYFEGV